MLFQSYAWKKWNNPRKKLNTFLLSKREFFRGAQKEKNIVLLDAMQVSGERILTNFEPFLKCF